MKYLTISEPFDDLPWSVNGDLRTPRSRFTESNYDYEDLIRKRLPEDVRNRITFDSEDCEFHAWCQTREDALAVLAIGEGLHSGG